MCFCEVVRFAALLTERRLLTVWILNSPSEGRQLYDKVTQHNVQVAFSACTCTSMSNAEVGNTI